MKQVRDEIVKIHWDVLKILRTKINLGKYDRENSNVQIIREPISRITSPIQRFISEEVKWHQ